MEEEIEEFKRRKGTLDRGKDYEEVSLANAIFQMVLNKNIDDFHVSCNDSHFEAFDDIVVKAKNDTEQKYALQLKHQGKTLKIENFNLGKDFDIQKYFDSYEEICKHDQNYKVVLVTNRHFEISSGVKIDLEKMGISVRILKVEDGHPQLLELFWEKDNCYKFELDPSSCNSTEEKEKYDNFFANFFLYTDQIDVDTSEDNLSKKFQETFYCSQTEFNSYMKFIKNWNNKPSKKEKLSKNVMKRVMALCVLSSSIKSLSFGTVNTKMAFLRNAIELFDVTLVDKNNCSNVIKLWGDIEYIVDDINTMKSRYELNSDNSDTALSKALWLLKKAPLIVKANKSVCEIINKLCQNDRFVLIVGKNFEEKIPNCRIFKDLSDLDKCSSEYKNLTNEMTCSLQGKHTINFSQLNCDEILTTNFLLEMTEKDVYYVNDNKNNPPTPYIKRFLKGNIVHFDYLNNIDSNKPKVIVIDCVNRRQEIEMQLLNFNILDVDNFINKNWGNSKIKIKLIDIFIAENNCSFEDFERLCGKVVASSYHHFCLTDDLNLKWLYTVGDIDDLRSQCLHSYFIDETSLYTQQQTNNKINLIIGEPGTGKTALLESLKINFPPNDLALIIYPLNISTLCRNLRDNKGPSDVNVFENFILEEMVTKDTFSQELTQIMMKQKRVSLMWDGLDEISIEDLSTISSFILKLAGENFHQYVTCRPRLKTHLEKKFSVLSQSILHFNEEQQTQYIKESLSNESTDDECKKIVANIKRLIKHDDILGVPLQIFMLTQIFSQNENKFSEVVAETFNITDLYEHFVDEKIDSYYHNDFRDDFRQEQEKRFLRRWYEETALNLLIPSFLKNDYEYDKSLEMIKNQGDFVGIITSLDEKGQPTFLHISFAEYFVASYFVKHRKTIDNLAEILFEDNYINIRFYFDMILAKDSPVHIAVLYRNIQVIRKFDSDALKKKDSGGRNLMHIIASWGQKYPIFKTHMITYLESQSRSVKKKSKISRKGYMIDVSDANQYTLEIEDSDYIQMVQDLAKICDTEEEDNIFKWTPIQYAEKVNAFLEKTLMLQSQKKQFSTLEDDLNIASFLYYSAKFDYDYVIPLFKNFPLIETSDKISLLNIALDDANCSVFYAIKLLLTGVYNINTLPKWLKIIKEYFEYYPLTHKQKEELMTHTQQEMIRILIYLRINFNIINSGHRTPFHEACINNNKKLLKFLINMRVDVNFTAENKLTGLHYACLHGHDNIVEILLSSDAKVNLAERDERKTPLHFACLKGHLNIVKQLIRAGAKLNVIDKTRITPLHLACDKSHDEIATLLITHSRANLNIGDDCGQRPIHVACYDGNEKLVEILINFHADVNVAESVLYQTCLHYACKRGFKNIVRMLIDANAIVNKTNLLDMTPLHYACSIGAEDIVGMLIEAEAEVNVVDNEGKTPLHYACERSDKLIVKMLLESNANIHIVDKNHRKPVDYAHKNRNWSIIRMLHT